ncbi:DUF2267 domain-containing protein [Nocardiopsis sp. CA-288880]|uniref:DUF2267 domain-containing protein n=1 Tax=Nocardiopsis sp. CA-288880 TaxID=3239995 RepID=UPI003D997BAA
MRYDEFVAEVRELGEYQDNREAAQVTEEVLAVLATRLPDESVDKLAAQLPDPLGAELREAGQPGAHAFGTEEFCRRVAERTGSREDTARHDAGAVLTAVAENVSGGELNQLLSHLPSGYAPLFGRAGLS